MSHTSPASFLVWSIITSLLGAFLLFHLWSFDRFKCLKWNSGPSSGAFKRVMTYSYFLSVPMIAVFAVGNAIIKYHEGFIDMPFMGIIPKPYQLWSEPAQRAIFPLMLMFSMAWSLEMVTHLEELCFWLFLVNSGSRQQNWFRSLYFKTWVVGSTFAVLYMPLVTIFSRDNPLQSEAHTFLAGSLGSLSLTLWFIPVLWTFPRFLENLRNEQVDMAVIVRLTKFSELNRIRVVFRLLFCVPLLILGIDGIRPHQHINESMAWTDALTMISGFGCAISSGITLVIFFPRSIEGEIAARDAFKERKQNYSQNRSSSIIGVASNRMTTSQAPSYNPRMMTNSGNSYLLTTPVRHTTSLPSYDSHTPDNSPLQATKTWFEAGERDHVAPLPPLRPNRRRGEGILLGGMGHLTQSNLSLHNLRELRASNVNQMVQNFTSPIDFSYRPHIALGDP